MPNRAILSRNRFAWRLVSAFMLALLGGCATQTWHTDADPLPNLEGTPVVLLMTPDVQLSQVTAGGLNEPHAEWTVAGLGNVGQAVADAMRSRDAAVVPYAEPIDEPDRMESELQLVKLHRAVGTSILIHKYMGLALPTKTNIFDWSMGPDVQQLGEAYKADYALFVYLRDSYVTPGRVAVIVAMAALGVGMPGGVQAGYASLIDLRTGEVLWFNRLVRGTGDLRTPGPAHEAVQALLDGFPL